MNCPQLQLGVEQAGEPMGFSPKLPVLSIYLSFFCCHQKKETKKNHRLRKFTKNLRHSLNCGNPALRTSDSPQFLTLIP